MTKVFLTKVQVQELIAKIDSLFVRENLPTITEEMKAFDNQFKYAAWVDMQASKMFGEVDGQSLRYWNDFIIEKMTNESLKKALKVQLTSFVAVVKG